MNIRDIFERIDSTNEFGASSDSDAFEAITSEIEPQMEQFGVKGPGDLKDDDKTQNFLDGLALVVKYAPGLKKIGEGSSRRVYLMKSGKYVLKMAMNYMGLV